jgi:hypothetical protein
LLSKRDQTTQETKEHRSKRFDTAAMQTLEKRELPRMAKNSHNTAKVDGTLDAW